MEDWAVEDIRKNKLYLGTAILVVVLVVGMPVGLILIQQDKVNPTNNTTNNTQIDLSEVVFPEGATQESLDVSELIPDNDTNYSLQVNYTTDKLEVQKSSIDDGSILYGYHEQPTKSDRILGDNETVEQISNQNTIIMRTPTRDGYTYDRILSPDIQELDGRARAEINSHYRNLSFKAEKVENVSGERFIVYNPEYAGENIDVSGTVRVATDGNTVIANLSYTSDLKIPIPNDVRFSVENKSDNFTALPEWYDEGTSRASDFIGFNVDEEYNKEEDNYDVELIFSNFDRVDSVRVVRPDGETAIETSGEIDAYRMRSLQKGGVIEVYGISEDGYERVIRTHEVGSLSS